MAYEEFVERKFRADSLKIIEQADAICKEYMAQGYTLTLRQLYYQFVARDLLHNKQSEYKRLGSIINDARLAGLIDWRAMEDRTRNLERVAHWSSPSSILEVCAQTFAYDRWENQPMRCEVWIEKEALVGVVEPVCNELRVPYFACRGYTSQSEQYTAAQRFRDFHEEKDQDVIIFHLGDHDPSGIDMTRDNGSRLEIFLQKYGIEHIVEVRRLALNMDQVRRYKPPPNPAKMTDSRFGGYEAKFGNKSWELDALNPTIIGDLLRDNIESITDDEAWETAIEREERARAKLKELSDNWKE